MTENILLTVCAIYAFLVIYRIALAVLDHWRFLRSGFHPPIRQTFWRGMG